jgi:multidrug efflux pump subunit AcrA (membrane-fusion protein)
MDTRELDAQLNDALKKALSARAQYDACVNSRDPDQQAQATVKQRQAEAYDAEADEKKLKIDQAHLKAAFDGVVLNGDLKNKRGSVVKLGEELFELAPTQKVWAKLAVPDRDIQELRTPGPEPRDWQKGMLATSSLPGVKIPFSIERIDPVGHPQEGENVYEVYARLDYQPGFLRPDMQGQANINVEPRRLVWIWTHRLVDFLRLHLWM